MLRVDVQRDWLDYAVAVFTFLATALPWLAFWRERTKNTEAALLLRNRELCDAYRQASLVRVTLRLGSASDWPDGAKGFAIGISAYFTIEIENRGNRDIHELHISAGSRRDLRWDMEGPLLEFGTVAGGGRELRPGSLRSRIFLANDFLDNAWWEGRGRVKYPDFAVWFVDETGLRWDWGQTLGRFSNAEYERYLKSAANQARFQTSR